MAGARTWGLAELAASALVHGAVLAAFGAPVALRAMERTDSPAQPQAVHRAGSRERPGRHDATRRLERELPKVRAEAPPEERKLVILRTGAGLADHDARATGGIPGIARPASELGPLGKRVLLPQLEPDQLENPRAASDRSLRRDEARSPLQRPELAPGFGLFASVVSAGRLQPEAGRPSAAPAQAEAQSENAAAEPMAEPRPTTPSTSALPPPPGSELAVASPDTKAPETSPEESERLRQQDPKGVEKPRIEGKDPEQARTRIASSPHLQPDPLFKHAAPLETVREKVALTQKLEPRERAEPARPQEKLARQGKESSPEDAEKKPEQAPSLEKQRARQPEAEEATSLAAKEHASGLWVAEGKSEEKREESGAKEPPQRPLAEGKPQDQPVRLAMAAMPRSPGAGAEDTRRAQIPSEAAARPESALTSREVKLGVEAFEGGEEGAHRADRSARSLAAPEPKLVGLETVEGHRDGESQAGRIVIAPEGDGSGDEVGLASVAGNADLRHLVQERVNHVASLVGPGLVKRTGQRGIAVVRFRVDAQGYVRAVKLERSAGSVELDREIEAVLRLAEPYRGWHGWMRVAVGFGTPPIDL